MVPLAIGLMAVGAGGVGYGMIKGRPKYQSPNFSDIDLSRDNPELYAEIQKYEEIGNQLESLYNQRRTGPTMSEQRMREDSLNDMRTNLASRGALGGSTSLLAEQDLNSRFQNDVMARAFQEQQALMAARLQQRAQQAQMFGAAQGQIYDQRANSAMMDYQGRMAQDQARNQMFTGLLGAGAGMYGNSQQASAMNANTAQLKRQNDYYMGVPQQQGGY